MNRLETLQALNDVHVFPGRFVFKVIGENTPEFVARVMQAAVTVLGPTALPEVSTRESSGGRHQAITMSVEVGSAERVLEVYGALQSLPGVKFLL